MSVAAIIACAAGGWIVLALFFIALERAQQRTPTTLWQRAIAPTHR